MAYAARPANDGAGTHGRRADYHSHVAEGQKRNVRPASGGAISYGFRRFARTQNDAQELEAFQEMCLASRQKFVVMACTILGNREDAEDAVQNAFLSAYRHLRTFEGRSALSTWLTRIVLNAALMIRRKRKAPQIDSLPEPNATDNTTWIERIPGSQPDPEMAYMEGETFQLIDGVLGNMPPALRQAFRLRYYDEMSVREACALLGVSKTTFKSRLFRARRHLLNKANRFRPRAVHQSTDLTFSFVPNDVQPGAASAADISSLQVALS